MRRTWAVAALTTALATSGMGVAAADVPVGGIRQSDEPALGPDDVTSRTGTGADGVVAEAVAPLATPDASWPATGRLTVYLCSKGTAVHDCHGKAVTAEQKRKLEKLLNRLPGVSDVRYVSQSEAYRNFREDTGRTRTGGQSSMPQYFRATLDRPNVKLGEKLEKLPGIASAVVRRSDFWTGKAAAMVRLCGPSNCANRLTITDHERDAVFEVLRNLQGVKKVYLETHRHAAQNHQRVFSGSLQDASKRTGQVFHLVLSSPADFSRIRPALKGLTGVHGISRHR
ncbi:permease-like cell division protein FtsX [Nonomuraea typhae]|uniref:Permease-like cell division protein FtsX n=1 Tax=Nonomuraea typhae TaxID=2603600 RepID=A0ABW7Z0N6_9ACTN